MKTIIIDDSTSAIEALADKLAKHEDIQLVGTANNGRIGLNLAKEVNPDVVFLDIELPDMSGVEFLEQMDNILPEQCHVVMYTGHPQYMLPAFRKNAFDYLLKPISYADFLQAAHKALHWFELLHQPREEITSIFVKSDYKLVQIQLDNILYIEGLKDYIKIYEEGASKPILSLMSMKAVEELLPASRFMRVHRSYIVQKEKIRIVDRGRILFGKVYIPVSDSYKQAFQEYLDKRS